MTPTEEAAGEVVEVPYYFSAIEDAVAGEGSAMKDFHFSGNIYFLVADGSHWLNVIIRTTNGIGRFQSAFSRSC